MKASEIVEKLRNVLLSSEAEEIEVNEPTQLGDNYEDDEKASMEEEEVNMMEGYVKKDEFDEKIAEMKAMYDKLMEKMADEEEEGKEVPEEVEEELSSEQPQKEIVEEQKEELSAQEPAVEPISHNPEVEVEKKRNIKLAQKRGMNTQDIVFNKLFNK
jgi:hypothetical protein